MATASTIFSFKIAPNPSPVSSFKEKTMTMNPSLSWDSAKTKVRRSRFPYFTLNYIERQRLENSRSCCSVLACLPSSASSPSSFGFNFRKTKLYVSGLSFRTTEESLRNAFQNFGQLVDVNLVMDKVAKRPRGFAFLRYETEDEAQKAIEGMHGKFLDGRVIFVEVAKPRSELRQSHNYGQR
ncbi:organelle RRM domain-containing protein 6 [Populus alba x Populus x berolinensis]|uniref:RNA recognition motif-containing family protein n=1 Tax=Populus alba TaxID=43335 RepID=A0A4U5MN96_POPAL|nr:organelle RRM domain-containing protein 6, chloroplastic [Populus alba]KAJ6888150.1 organelle RRM domain-containing protein 6 [Populus alba x Populus x berolinensis]TKR71069.1 RNA recognition motif-containing family protein [Populus alba]